MNKTAVLLIAAILIVIGLTKPDFKNILNHKPVVVDNTIIEITRPLNEELLDECEVVTICLKNGPSSRTYDGKRLAQLYWDISSLIELDGENEVIKTTEDIRQANSISGTLLHLDMKNKYPGLADAAKALISASIGDDQLLLDSGLRTKAVEGFRALAWACNEGSK